jgi:hypothetical protein
MARFVRKDGQTEAIELIQPNGVFRANKAKNAKG